MVSAAERAERLAQLQEVTAVGPEIASALLEATGWNVESAVALHFAGGVQDDFFPTAYADSDPSRPAQAAPSPYWASARSTESGGVVAGGSGAPAEDGSESDEEAAECEAVEEPAGWFGSIGRSFTGLRQRIAGVASEDFSDWFACRFGAPVPAFSTECFGEVIKGARDEGRLVLLWLHQEEGPATDDLCRNIFQKSLVVRLIRRSYVVWAGDVSRFEPGQIARLLGVETYPALVVCEPLRSGFEPAAYILEWPLGTFAQPLFRLAPTSPGEALDSDQAIAALTAAAEEHRDAVQAHQVQTQRRTSQLAEERRLREEQDREFEESLLMDQLATAAKMDESAQVTDSPSGCPSAASIDTGVAAAPAATPEATPSAASIEAEAEARELAEAEEAEARRQARGAEILAEPEPALAGSATAKLALRLPSGDRLQRVFLAEQRLEEVYEWAHCCRPKPKPASFELCTNFPARTLVDRSATIVSLGLTPSAALMMKSID
mmetsp:Transcript_7243/g.16272  ORF Transcript_7243/g.16272 Transcript_7243/m.16272 type:complete len:493 (+) Transcript_7243:31-1509(+)